MLRVDEAPRAGGAGRGHDHRRPAQRERLAHIAGQREHVVRVRVIVIGRQQRRWTDRGHDRRPRSTARPTCSCREQPRSDPGRSNLARWRQFRRNCPYEARCRPDGYCGNRSARARGAGDDLRLRPRGRYARSSPQRNRTAASPTGGIAERRASLACRVPSHSRASRQSGPAGAFRPSPALCAISHRQKGRPDKWRRVRR